MTNGMIAGPQGYPGGAVTNGVGTLRSAPLTRKGHEGLGVTARALRPCESPGPHRAVEECAELLFEEHRQPAGIGAGGGREERFEARGRPGGGRCVPRRGACTPRTQRVQGSCRGPRSHEPRRGDNGRGWRRHRCEWTEAPATADRTSPPPRASVHRDVTSGTVITVGVGCPTHYACRPRSSPRY